MTGPLPTGKLTARVYAALPDIYRAMDAAQSTPTFPLLRYLGGLLDQLDDVETFLDRNAYVPDDVRHGARKTLGTGTLGTGMLGDPTPHDLVDPYLADGAWLPWLAQLLGVTDDPTQTLAARRFAIANPSLSWAHATPGAIAALVRPHLTGTQRVDVWPGYGDPWSIGIVTMSTETPAAGVLQYAQRECPSGYRLIGVTLVPGI